MGNGSTKTNDNIYFVARKEAAIYDERLFSREGAADMLGLSVSSLADYELGNTKVVPVDKVVLMADLYNAPQLKAQYCKNACPIGSSFYMATEIKPIEKITLGLLNKLDFDKLEEIKRVLIELSLDENINEEEHHLLDEVKDFFNRLQEKTTELTLLIEKKKADKLDGWCKGNAGTTAK